MTKHYADDTASPMITNVLLAKLTAFMGLLALFAILLTVAGKYYGKQLSDDGHTASSERYAISIGQDVMDFPANMIRFETQRHSGEMEVINLYLSWPEMAGYTNENRMRFSDPQGSKSLIFIELSQSVMSRDMTGRLDPIYKRLFAGEPEQGPAGLTLHRLNPRSGFGKEVILTGAQADGSQFVVRCVLPKTPQLATSADCQRDIHVGHDLSLLYRFSSSLLAEWRQLDPKIRTFARTHMAR